MTTPREQAVADLRQAIDVLPERTRQAMLVGLSNNTVIAGAFSSGGGGACPMVAAHRAGGRTSACSFPQAWDRFCGVAGRNLVRPATEYEISILRREIEASLAPAPASELAEAIADHKAIVEARLREEQLAARAEQLAAQRPQRRRLRITGGERIEFGDVIQEHKSSARRRREVEAEATGLEWLFEETLVLPEDFGAEEPAEEFDFEAAEADLARG